uniref:Uncharacterized protein n=1 Tax=Arion vulgaris TaxID=1028688 RepID=A0A0B7AJL7_9EUPU
MWMSGLLDFVSYILTNFHLCTKNTTDERSKSVTVKQCSSGLILYKYLYKQIVCAIVSHVK